MIRVVSVHRTSDRRRLELVQSEFGSGEFGSGARTTGLRCRCLRVVRRLAPLAATCGGRLPLTSGHYILRLLEIPDSLVGGLCGNGLGVVIQDNFEVLFN